MENPSRETFQVGKALSTTFQVWLKNLPAFMLLSAICYLPFVLYTGVTFSGDGPSLDGVVTYFRVVGVLGSLVAYVVAGAIVYGAVQQLRGLHAPTVKSISVGLGRLVPVLLVAIATSLCVAVGMILLIVPGLILACMFYVAVPVAVLERQGVMGALKRSQELTNGNKVQIFGLFIILGVINWVLMRTLSGVFMDAGGFSTLAWASIVISMVTSSIGAVAQAVVYYQLRQEKDGVSIDELAQVFE